MLRECNCKIIPTFGLMSKCIKYYDLLKVQLHGKSKKKKKFKKN